MASEEKIHARQFVAASSLKGPQALPSSNELSKKVLESVWKTKKEVLENTGLSLEDAFRIAVSLEESTVERFLQRMTAEETDVELKRFFETLIIEGTHHAKLLKKRFPGISQDH